MGIQDSILMEASPSLTEASSSFGRSAKAADAFHYITDLLGELHSIANMSGLSALSDDLETVISKHMSSAAA